MKNFNKIFVIIALSLLSGCASNLTQYEKDEREYWRGERDRIFLERYYQKAASCGGYMVVIRRSITIHCRRNQNCPPNWGDSYYCANRGITIW